MRRRPPVPPSKSALAEELHERGVYLERYRVNGQRLIVAIDSRSERVAERTAETADEQSAAEAELWELLDMMDPIPPVAFRPVSLRHLHLEP
jgi:hypothetical protein